MKKVRKRKRREYVRCSVCSKLIPLTSISTIKVPKHRDRFEPSSYCAGSDEPIESIIKRYE